MGLYVVEPEEGEMEQLIPATESLRPIQVALSYDGEHLLVVMSDGELRMYEAHDLDLLASASGFLSDEIDPGFWARPHIATAPGHIFITDSAAGEVLALDNHDLEVVGHWDVDGTPTKIAFVGILDKEEHPEQGHDDHGHEREAASGDGHGHDHDHDHGEGDPHFWLNPRMVVHYVNQIANGLVAADPDNARPPTWTTPPPTSPSWRLWTTYITDTVAGVPHELRVIVTFHDAFGYFGTRYDFEVMAFVGGHAGDVSPDDIARVLDLVEDRGLSVPSLPNRNSPPTLWNRLPATPGSRWASSGRCLMTTQSRLPRYDARQRGCRGRIGALTGPQSRTWLVPPVVMQPTARAGRCLAPTPNRATHGIAPRVG